MPEVVDDKYFVVHVPAQDADAPVQAVDAPPLNAPARGDQSTRILNHSTGRPHSTDRPHSSHRRTAEEEAVVDFRNKGHTDH